MWLKASPPLSKCLITPGVTTDRTPQQGDGKTSLHGSYGIFYDTTLGAIAGVTQTLNGTSGVRTLVVTLGQSCAGVPCSVLAWNSPGRQLPEATARTLLGGSYP